MGGIYIEFDWFKKDVPLQNSATNAMGPEISTLITDHKTALIAAKKDGWTFYDLPHELKNDRKIVLAAVDGFNNRLGLEHAPVQFKNDREIVSVAVGRDPYDLEYASDELKNDRDIVLKAILQNGRVLQYASRSLRADIDILLTAVLQSPQALSYAPLHLRDGGLDTYIRDILSRYTTSKEDFQSTFLFGFTIPKKSISDDDHDDANSLNPPCKIYILNNGLGKYGSLAVKKLVAEYVGIRKCIKWKKMKKIIFPLWNFDT
jgi:hypothetical protein